MFAVIPGIGEVLSRVVPRNRKDENPSFASDSSGLCPDVALADSQMFSRKGFQRSISCLAIILSVSAFYLATIRLGQPWGDDFAMYIQEAKNMANGTPLRETGYIYNPSVPEVGPRLYPPVFPVLLVPAYMIGHLKDLTAMEVEAVLFFIGLLVLLALGLGRELPGSFYPAMLAIVGFNPLLWKFKESIVSDIPFTLFLYLTFMVTDKLAPNSAKARGERWQIPALGALVYLCYGTRTVGFVLLPALLILAGIYWKSGGQRVAWAAALGLVPCLIQQRLLGTYVNYGDHWSLSLPTEVKIAIDNASTYTWHLSMFWANPYAKAIRNLLFVGATALALWAYCRRLWSSPRIYEIFFPLYLGVIVLWPYSGGFRFLIPIVPLYVFYLLEGVVAFSRFLSMPSRVTAFAFAFVLIAGSYGAEFGHSQFGHFKESVDRKDSVELFSFVQSHTAPNDIFMFQKPRALALFTGRKASVYPLARTTVEFCDYFKMIGATYLIEAPALDDSALDDLIDRDFSNAQPSFSNGGFRVLHIGSGNFEKCGAQQSNVPSTPDLPGAKRSASP